MGFIQTSDGHKLNYLEAGSGEPLILIHGLTANLNYFKKQIPSLSRRYRVVAYDLRGHGLSEGTRGLTLERYAQDLKELMDHFEVRKASIACWSMGAHVVFEYIRTFGCDRLGKLVIIDMSPKLLKADDWRFGLAGASGKPGDFGHEDNLLVLAAMCRDWDAYSRVVAERILMKPRTSEKLRSGQEASFKGKDDLPWIYEHSRANNPFVIVSMWIAMAMKDYRPVLPGIKCPCLLTYGTESNYYGPDNYEYMKSRMPDASILPFEGCGHALHLQEPDKFNQAVMDFLG
jgi:pimeloyl-ACP methyl ester carboxylesterase